ncbi:hypothetical protein HPB47_003367, partial [Ixodes persulcatus]
VLTGEKEAQVEEMLRKQYEQYRQQWNGRRDRNKEEAVGRPVELERRPIHPPSERVTSSPVEHFGRSVQKLSGEKSGKQTELLRRMYERAESSRSIKELRRRPVEEVDRTGNGLRVLERVEGTSRERNEWKFALDKLTPEIKESYLKDLRKDRMEEETDPVIANQFLSRYQNTWNNRTSQHTNSLDKEPPSDALNEDNVDDKDDNVDELQNDQPEEDIPLTTASTEDTSSESSEEKLDEGRHGYLYIQQGVIRPDLLLGLVRTSTAEAGPFVLGNYEYGTYFPGDDLAPVPIPSPTLELDVTTLFIWQPGTLPCGCLQRGLSSTSQLGHVTVEQTMTQTRLFIQVLSLAVGLADSCHNHQPFKISDLRTDHPGQTPTLSRSKTTIAVGNLDLRHSATKTLCTPYVTIQFTPT